MKSLVQEAKEFADTFLVLFFSESHLCYHSPQGEGYHLGVFWLREAENTTRNGFRNSALYWLMQIKSPS